MKVFKKIIQNDIFQSYIWPILKAIYIVLATAALVFCLYLFFGMDYLEHIREEKQAEKNALQAQEKVHERINEPKYYYEDYRSFWNHADEMLILYEDNWNKATDEEKLEGAKQALYLAAGSLTLPGEFELEVINFRNGIADYDFNNNIVQIDSKFLYSASSCNVFSCIFHETYKIYEWSCINAYIEAKNMYKNIEMFEKAKAYYKEMTQGGETVECPYERICFKNMEEDAQYATKRMSDSFFKFIANYQFRNEITEKDKENEFYSMWER